MGEPRLKNVIVTLQGCREEKKNLRDGGAVHYPEQIGGLGAWGGKG